MFEKLAKKVVLRSSVLPSGIRLMLLLLLFEMCGKHEEKEKVYFRLPDHCISFQGRS